MPATQRFAHVLAAWSEKGHTQAKFAQLTGLNATGVGRMFKGEQRPEVETMARILAGLEEDHRELARELLEAYLLDDIPEGVAIDGRTWAEHVRLKVDDIGTPRMKDEPTDEFEAALARFIHTARTTLHGRNFVLGLDKWSKGGNPQGD